MDHRLHCEARNGKSAKRKFTLQDTGIMKDFLQRTLFAQKLRPVIDKWDPIKLIQFKKVKETVNSVKKIPNRSDRGLLFITYKD